MEEREPVTLERSMRAYDETREEMERFGVPFGDFHEARINDVPLPFYEVALGGKLVPGGTSWEIKVQSREAPNEFSIDSLEAAVMGCFEGNPIRTQRSVSKVYVPSAWGL